MSVVSSRVSSVSSLLKDPGIRSQLIRQSNRVYLKLPKNLRSILFNFEAGNGTKNYEDLICILRNSDIKDADLIEFLSNVRQCISLLGPVHKVLVETLLQIKWTNRSLDVTSAYKVFIEDLICMQIHYAKNAIDNLIEQFKPDDNDGTEWKIGVSKEDIQRLNHIHNILQKVLKVVPMSSKLLLQSLGARFPYFIQGTHTHEVYIYALIQILEYAPHLQSDILSLIINRLMVLDVNIPRLEIDNEEEDLMDDNSECNSTLGNENNVEENNIAETDKIHPIAHKLDVFKTAVVEAFIDWLWRKASDPNVPSIIRQSSVAYIASLLVTAKFVTTGLVKAVQLKISKWIHDYINMQDHSSYIMDENKEHKLDLAKIITCKLNPLKACDPEIMHSFAEITRMYQLAYCYTIIENNTRNQLPLFDKRSGQRITPILRDNVNNSEHRTTIKYRKDIEHMTEY
ncbi:RNA polymerase I-specific transcription initiation factor RRN3 [Melipona quadrifasciata]|uniref:RNA polymerase I-specific transcription initiation factor RRN3 n=1 Tax=Melipona quadrifasciata TaxID=166423 RepID=A0A0M8ZPN1_9HYME|nr:RNA polymerase I-specific transcription initiation factor RRN3 [Melipona quadrifasciata]